MSCHLVQVNIASLHNATLDFLGTTLNFLGQPGIKNAFTFSSEDGDEATFTVDTEHGAVWGHARLADGRDFVIEPNLDNCNGCHVVIKENLDAFPPDHAVVPQVAADRSRSTSEWARTDLSDLLERGKTDKTTRVTYTIKLYYTPEVKNSIRTSGSNIMEMAKEVIAITNQGYINSEIPLRASLHCLEETEKPEAFFTRTRGPGKLNTFRMYKGGGNGLRGSADAAVLIVKDIEDCGLGYLVSSTAGYENWIVSMTRYDCALDGFTFGHEIGHNMGLDHDKHDEKQLRITPYSKGYHMPGTQFRTVMTYERREEPNNWHQINYYSNPRVKFHIRNQNFPTGSAEEADAARRITEVRFVLAANGDESQECVSADTSPLDEGVISSPNFPSNYPDDFTNRDTIQVDAGQVIRLEFTDFDVEIEDACNYDSLTITETSQNGKTTILMEKRCGATLPPVIVSTTNKVNMLFKTDGSETKKGWSLRWTAVTLNEGVISSPNFPGTYPNNFTNTYTIQVDAGQVIRLEFEAFNIEFEKNACNYDSLTISETKPNEKARTLMAKHCGDILPPVIISTTNKVDLMFKTDGSVTSTGWSVKWTAITPNA